MTAPDGVDAIEPEKRAKPRPGGRGFVSRLTSDGHRSAALVFLRPRGLLGGLVDRLRTSGSLLRLCTTVIPVHG